MKSKIYYFLDETIFFSENSRKFIFLYKNYIFVPKIKIFSILGFKVKFVDFHKESQTRKKQVSDAKLMKFISLIHICTFDQMRFVCPRTTRRVLVVQNLIYDKIHQKNMQDASCRSRTHESHSFENREISQTYKIVKNQQNTKIIEK